MSNANVISVSGGKDSTATALLAIKSGAENLRFVFADTGHEHPKTMKYLEYLDKKLISLSGRGVDVVRADFAADIELKREQLVSHLIALADGGRGNRRLKQYTIPTLNRMIDVLFPTNIPFLDLCLWKGRFPGTRTRFCSQELKHKPLNEYHQALVGSFSAVISWQGVRWDESNDRKDLPAHDVEFGSWEPETFGLLIYRPILAWKAADTFALHREMGVEWNPLYEEGMGRVGCMPCIHARKAEMREIARRYPGELARVAEWERLVSLASKRGASTFMDGRVTARFLGTPKGQIETETHGIQTYAEWAMTTRGGKQFDLIHAIDKTDIPQCTSVYGLCE